jgi:hypothetical protein
MLRRPDASNSVSRARSGAWSVVVPSEIAARINARAVIDLDPGSRTVALTALVAVGAAHPSWALVISTFCGFAHVIR